VPQLILQYMFPLTMLLAAAITITSSYAGPRGNNEYVVIRSAGVPVLRSFLPLLLPAFLVAGTFQACRDYFLPDMVRDSNTILNRLRSRVSIPTSFTHYSEHGIQTVAIGSFEPGGKAHNLILEIRDPAAFQRGNPALGDNDFTAYRAASARLEPAPGGGYQWTPEEKGAVHSYTRFSRTSVPWTEPVPTGITPAMIERQPLGDAVSSWHDLLLMERDSPGAAFELHWRLAEPVACVLLILWGAGLCMWRMLRGRAANYIASITVSMGAAALFYLLRLTGKTLWEGGALTAVEGVWLPLAAAAVLTLPITFKLEP
jgi:lipopolysaccharide export LptBFGC system permease protein LptF